jgi:transketolase
MSSPVRTDSNAHARGRLGWGPDALAKKAREVRRDIITLLTNAGSGHTAGPLSIADFGTVLFFHELNVDPANPEWVERDFWHFSCGHVTPVIYSLMAERGYFPLKDLLGFRQLGGQCQGHPSAHDTPGIEISSGSLGQGLSVCSGVAMASKLDKSSRRVYAVLSDGEHQEGSIWEAAMSSAHYKLDNLCAIVDYNRKQIDGDVEDVMGLKPLGDKYRSFNWHVIDIDGHDLPKLIDAFAEARATKGRPTVILANTLMGKDVPWMEDDHSWHGKPPNLEEGERALEPLGTNYAEWRERLEEN